MRNKYYTSRDPIKNYFPLPNEVFALGLSPGALAVYSYLMYIEDRTTYQCHASYKTIGKAVNMSPNTVGNSVKSLGKQKKTSAYAQHCTNQNSDTAKFASLPLYNPLDLLWRCTNRPKLPVALDFVIDGDTEDTLDHNVAANQNNGNHASHQCKIKGFRDI